jgi:RNA polymerase sigma factor (sigma-70 family)
MSINGLNTGLAFIIPAFPTRIIGNKFGPRLFSTRRFKRRIKTHKLKHPSKVKLSIIDHLGLAYEIVRPYADPGERVEDLDQYSDALLGLWDAVKTYDGRIKFSFFARRCMLNRIHEGHRNRSRHDCDLAEDETLQNVPEKPTVINLFDDPKLVKVFLSRHRNDSEKDYQKKQLLRQHFMEGMSWAEIARRNRVSRAAVQQAGLSAIKLIRKQHASLIFQILET